IRVWREGPAPGSNATVVVSPATGSQPAVRLPEGAVSSDHALTPVLAQFEQLQQQSYDEFHQSMLLVLQMFNILERERLDPVREHLDQVYKLTLELQSLHTSTQPPQTAPTPLHEGAAPASTAFQRVATLQQERHSRWHKVLD